MIRYLTMLVMAVITVVAAAAVSGSAYDNQVGATGGSTAPVQAETVQITAPDGTTYATASGAWTSDHWVWMLPKGETAFQTWEITPRREGGSLIVNRGTGGCLMLDIAGPLFGYVVQRTCTGQLHEAWEIRPVGTEGLVMIHSLGGNGCLTRALDTGAAPRLRWYTCDGVRQEFRLKPTAP